MYDIKLCIVYNHEVSWTSGLSYISRPVRHVPR